MTPNAPKTPARTVRIPDIMWERLRALAAEQGLTPSDLIREAIEDWLHEHDDD